MDLGGLMCFEINSGIKLSQIPCNLGSILPNLDINNAQNNL